MKKLMIATAALALGASGAYATEGCCGIDPTTSAECKANVYQLKMSLKTLVPKKVTKNGCVGLYFEQGTRTIDGYVWTCCDPCGINGGVNPDLTEEYQITLWEKAAQCGILNGVEWGSTPATATTNVMYKATATYQIKDSLGNWIDEEVTIGTFTYDETQAADENSKYKKAYKAVADAYLALATASQARNWSYSLDRFTEITTTDAGFEGWIDEDFVSALNGDTAFARFSKTANKVTVQFEATGSGCDTGSIQDASRYHFVAAGFGTFDAKSVAVKSASGSVVGTLPSLDLCDEYADVLGLCDEFETWCDVAGRNEEIAVPAFGTWTMKYVKKMGSLYTAVPAYNRQ